VPMNAACGAAGAGAQVATADAAGEGESSSEVAGELAERTRAGVRERPRRTLAARTLATSALWEATRSARGARTHASGDSWLSSLPSGGEHERTEGGEASDMGQAAQDGALRWE